MSSDDQIIHRWLATKDQKLAAVRRYKDRIAELRQTVTDDKDLTEDKKNDFLLELDAADKMVENLERELNSFIKALKNWQNVRKVGLPDLNTRIEILQAQIKVASDATKSLARPIISYREREIIVSNMASSSADVQGSQMSQPPVLESLPPPPRSRYNIQSAQPPQQGEAFLAESEIISATPSAYSAGQNQDLSQMDTAAPSSDIQAVRVDVGHRIVHAHNQSIASTNTFGYAKHSYNRSDEQAGETSEQSGHDMYNSSASSRNYRIEDSENRTLAHDDSEVHHGPGHSANMSVSSSNTFGYPSNPDDN
ncbi:hypothetical protein JR316_0008854 [Psilocybe cubensis]|uniref:Uncharacterized protein n=2 Tax=Psilocybe cubensis TaxID=181762 RepID=A0ACB8GTU0_PSICU|nr:hypothetical protein JR316_0008854 [Psilocybe cubensis]KAH9478400.1 hypothetical protein JR316_0008854 [Psilocybe cubensis]